MSGDLKLHVVQWYKHYGRTRTPSRSVLLEVRVRVAIMRHEFVTRLFPHATLHRNTKPVFANTILFPMLYYLGPRAYVA